MVAICKSRLRVPSFYCVLLEKLIKMCSSAATILSLMEEGSFDYGSIFTDQAP